MTRISVKNLVKTFVSDDGGNERITEAVKDVSFTVNSGKIFTLLGPSGCGKTTTLRCIAGLEKPEAGEIIIGETVVVSSDVFIQCEKRELGMVFQSYAIWPHMNVFENVAYPLKVKRFDKTTIKQMVKEALELVQLNGLEERSVTKLSGGQQQRVAVARALVYKPKVILLDEPLSNLDAKLREHMRAELRELLHNLEMTTVYVTHDQLEALTLSDEIAVMYQGKVLEKGTPMQIHAKPRCKFVADFIGIANLIKGTVKNGCIETDIGSIKCGIPAHIENGSPVLLCVRPEAINVGKNLKGENVFHGSVETALYAGAFYDCWIKLGEYRLRAKVNPMIGINEGDEVCVKIDPILPAIIEIKIQAM